MKQLLLVLGLCALSITAFSQAVPELIYYQYNGVGLTVPNMASSPVGTNPANLQGNQTQGPTGQFGGAQICIGGSSGTDFLNTGWATNVGTADWTISLWLGNNVPSAGLNYFFGDNTSASFRCFTGGVAGTGVYLRGGGLQDVIIPGPLFTNPVVLTFVYDGMAGEVRAYVDGVLTVTTPQTGPNLSGAGPFKVGAYGTGANTTGNIDEFRFYDRAVPAAEITATWNQPLPLVSGPKDIAVTTLVQPVSGASGCYGSAETVELNFWNFGSDTIFFDTDTVQFTCNTTGTNPQTFVEEMNSGFIAPASNMNIVMTTTYDMSAPGPYIFDAYSEFLSGGPDVNPVNDTLATATLTNNNVIVTPGVPFEEDFETFLIGNPGTLMNGWTFGTPGVPNWYVEDSEGANENTFNTGPWFDNTTPATAGGIYMYTETSGGIVGAEYELVTPCLDLTGVTGPTLQYAYHMYGADCGFLKAQVLSGGTWFTVDSLNGQQQTAGDDPWGIRSVSLGTYAGQVVQIRFVGQKISTSGLGDISIDDVSVFEPAPFDLELLATTEPPNPSCSFTANENITIEFQNVGSDTVNMTDIEATYTITGPINSGPVTEVLMGGAVPPGMVVTYTFTAGADLSTPGLYTIATEVDFTAASGLTDAAFFNNVDTVAVQPGLVGNLTIDASLPTGGTNYQTFNDAVNALHTFGVCGSVVFHVSADTFNEQVTINEIVGVDANNTVTFDGGLAYDPVLTHDATTINATVLLEGADWITFRNMTIESTGASDAWGVLLYQGADHNTIDSCTINVNPSGTLDVAGVVASNSLINDNFSGTNANYLTVSNSIINGGEKSITLEGLDPLLNMGHSIINNILNGADDFGVEMDDQDSVTIVGNTVTGLRNNFSDGIYLFDVRNYTIESNNVHAKDWGMYILDGNDGNNPTVRSRIVNNMFSSDTDYGMYLNDIESTDVFHNNTLGGTTAGMRINDPISIDIRSNIFEATSGVAFWADDNLLGMDSIDYNLYNTQTGTNIANLGTGGTVADLATWQAAAPNFNQSSLEGSPDYVSPTNLHIAGTLPNNVGDPSLGITEDIDGDMRNLAMPDMGADEFTPLATDLGVTGFVTPISGCGLQDSAVVTMVVRNFGTDTAYTFDISYRIGGSTTTESISDTLAPGASKAYAFTGTTDLSVPGIYMLDGWPTLVGDTNFGNDTLLAYTVEHLNAISTFPYEATFDNPSGVVPPGWIQQADDSGQDWIIDAGGTTSANTGPPVDHTFGTTTAFYAYVEDSGLENDSVTLITPCFDVSALNSPLFYFWYHSNNADGPGAPTENEMHIDLIYNGTITYDIIPPIIHKDNFWNLVEIDMSAYIGVFAIRFRVNNNNGWFSHDIAIDDIGVKDILEQDAATVDLYSPASNCGLTSTDTLSLGVFNEGTDTIFGGFDVSYQINGGPVTTTTINDTIFPMGSIVVNFAPVDFSPPGVYNILAWNSGLMGDTNFSNDTLAVTVVSDPAVGLPVYEDFDTASLGATVFPQFTNVGALDWQVDAAGTPSFGTGPASDFTGVNYAYIESNSGASGQSAILCSDCIDLTGYSNPALFYAYHMFGATMGTLTVQVNTSSSTNTVNNIVGAQQGANGDPWLIDTVDLSPWAGQIINVCFTGVIGGTTSDMALDGLEIRELVDDDMSGLAMLQPPGADCSSDSTVVEVQVTNVGLQPQSNIPVTVSYSGAAAGTLMGTIPGPVNPGDTVNFVVGFINTNVGGTFNFTTVVGLPGDTIAANDSIFSSANITVTSTPPIASNVEICQTDSAQFTLTAMAANAADTTISWYDAQMGGNQLATGDTFITPFIMSNTTYWVQANSGGVGDSLTTFPNFGGGNGQAGNMFDVTALSGDIRIDSLDIHIGGTASEIVEVYITDEPGGYAGNNLNPAAWTLVGSQTVTGAGVGVPTRVNGLPPIIVPAGQTIGMYVTLSTSTNIDYTNGLPGDFDNDGSLQVDYGFGVPYPFGNPFSVRVFNGTFYYSSGCPSERVPVEAIILPPVAVDLGPDAVTCAGFVIDAFDPDVVSYLWNTTETSSSIVADTTGTYYVDVVNADGCTGSDTINLNILPSPFVDLGPDSIQDCGMVTLDAGNPGSTFEWNVPGQFGQTLDVNSTGTYWVEADLSGCTDSDTIFVIILEEPDVDLGGAIASCNDVTLDAGNPGSTYSWSTNETTQTITVTPPMAGTDTITVTVTSANGCEVIDEVLVSFGIAPTVDLGPDSTYCDSVVLDAGNAGATYMWMPNGETSQTIVANTAGTYSVTVTDSVGCESTDEVDIGLNVSPTASPTFDWISFGYTIDFFANATPGATVSWDFGDGTPVDNNDTTSHTYAFDGVYTVTLTVTNECGEFQTTFDVGPVSIDELFSQSIELYPNPTQNTFVIRSEDLTAAEVSIEVFNARGQIIYTYLDQNVVGLEHQVDLSEHPEGVYMVKISDGERQATKRVVRE